MPTPVDHPLEQSHEQMPKQVNEGAMYTRSKPLIYCRHARRCRKVLGLQHHGVQRGQVLTHRLLQLGAAGSVSVLPAQTTLAYPGQDNAYDDRTCPDNCADDIAERHSYARDADVFARASTKIGFIS
jgi:hypothetical protein